MKFEPTMEVVRFESADVIAASGPSVVLSYMHDNGGANNTISFGGRDYHLNSKAKNPDDYHEFRENLSNYVGDAGLASKTGGEVFFGGISVFNLTTLKDSPDANGTYTYDGVGTYTFTKKT